MCIRDRSWAVIENLRRENQNIKGIKFQRNYGKSAALNEGFKAAQGEVVLSLIHIYTGLLLKALQYVLPLQATIIQIPDDKSVAPHGLMNEGIASTQFGLAGKPGIAEEIMIARDIELLRYTGSVSYTHLDVYKRQLLTL